jgi:hypothetical protein
MVKTMSIDSIRSININYQFKRLRLTDNSYFREEKKLKKEVTASLPFSTICLPPYTTDFYMD